MLFVIASDIHGAAPCCRALLDAFAHEGAARLVLLGDILYHGPRNPLPEGYDPKEVIAMLNPLADRLLCVRGNCDTEVDQMVLRFPILAEYAYLDAGMRPVFATHGHHHNTQTPPPLRPGEILLHGHTHVPAWGWVEDLFCANPGSVSLPRGRSDHSCLLYEDGVFRWLTLEGEDFHWEAL